MKTLAKKIADTLIEKDFIAFSEWRGFLEKEIYEILREESAGK